MPRNEDDTRSTGLFAFIRSAVSTPDNILSSRGAGQRELNDQSSRSQRSTARNVSDSEDTSAPSHTGRDVESSEGTAQAATSGGRQGIRICGIRLWKPPTEPDPDPERRYGWNKDAIPGGFRLWCRLVVGFTLLAVVGVVFITLGAVFFQESYRLAMEEDLSVPLVWCVIGIACGVLFFCGSIVLGKLMNSNRWRRNQQPNYRNLAPPTTDRAPVVRARYVSNRTDRTGDGEAATVEFEFPFPPSYEEAARTNNHHVPPAIFVLSAGNVNINTHPGVHVSQLAAGDNMDHPPNPPSYSDNAGPPPSYSDPPPGGATAVVSSNHSDGEQTTAAQISCPAPQSSNRDDNVRQGSTDIRQADHDTGQRLDLSGSAEHQPSDQEDQSLAPPPYTSTECLHDPELILGNDSTVDVTL